MVRATAVAVTGSLEGVLMMASEREIAFQTIVCTLIPGALPAITCTHRAPKARRRILLPDRTPRGCPPTLPDNRSRRCDPQWHGSRAEPAYANWMPTDAPAPQIGKTTVREK